MNKDKRSRKTIVFLHGWGGNISSWQNNVPFFEERGYKCIAIQMPGFDLPEPDPSWGIPEYTDFVANKLRAETGNQGCVLVGHSFGGRVSVYLAAQYPNLVHTLVLTDAAGLNLEPKIARESLILLSKTFTKAEERLPALRRLRRTAVSLIGSKGYKSATPVMREVMKNVVNHDLSKCLPNIKCSTLLVWGEEDRTTPLSMAREFNKGIPSSQLKVIPNAEHAPHRTHSEIWNELVREFLEE